MKPALMYRRVSNHERKRALGLLTRPSKVNWSKILKTNPGVKKRIAPAKKTFDIQIHKGILRYMKTGIELDDESLAEAQIYSRARSKLALEVTQMFLPERSPGNIWAFLLDRLSLLYLK